MRNSRCAAALLAWRLRGRLSLIHHVSPITLRAPSAFGAVGLPFIWGPVGGTIPFPPGFEAYSQGWGSGGMLRRLDRLRLQADPTMLFTQTTADRIVVTSTMAAENVPRRYLDKTVVIPGGVSATTVLDGPVAEEPYIFSSGRLVPYKAMDLLIRAMARVRGMEGVKLIITGDGPLRNRLEELIVSVGSERKSRIARSGFALGESGADEQKSFLRISSATRGIRKRQSGGDGCMQAGRSYRLGRSEGSDCPQSHREESSWQESRGTCGAIGGGNSASC